MTLFDAVLSPFDGLILAAFMFYLGYGIGFQNCKATQPPPEPARPRRM
jgi:hypothetical protein